MKLSIVIATICSASLGLAAVAQPRQSCNLAACPGKCADNNMTFKESDCWGARAICICVDKNGVEYGTTA